MRQSLMILLWILFVALPVQAERDVRNSQFGGGAGAILGGAGGGLGDPRHMLFVLL